MRFGRWAHGLGCLGTLLLAAGLGSDGVPAQQLAAIGDPADQPSVESGEPVAPVAGCAPGARCTWERTYGGRREDKAYAVAALADDGLAVVGHSRSFSGHYDGWFLGLDRSGEERWQRVLGGRESEQAYGVVPAPGGGVVIVGQTRSRGHGESDLWLVRLDAAGEVVWDRTIGGPANDRGRAIAALPDGDVAIAGFATVQPDNGRDLYVARVDAEGGIVWQDTRPGPADDGAVDVAAAPDGGLLVTGYRRMPGPRGYDLQVLRYDAEGAVAWERLVDIGIFDSGTSVVPLADGGAAVAGVFETAAGDLDARVLRLAADGTVLWDRAFGGPRNDSAWGLVAGEGGGVVVSGATESQGAGSTDAWLFALDGAGTLRWERHYGGALWDRPMGLTRAADGGLLVAGTTTTMGAGYEDFWVLRLDAEGRLRAAE